MDYIFLILIAIYLGLLTENIIKIRSYVALYISYIEDIEHLHEHYEEHYIKFKRIIFTTLLNIIILVFSFFTVNFLFVLLLYLYKIISLNIAYKFKEHKLFTINIFFILLTEIIGYMFVVINTIVYKINLIDYIL